MHANHHHSDKGLHVMNHYRVVCIYTGRLLWIGKAKTERGAMRKAGSYSHNSIVVLG